MFKIVADELFHTARVSLLHTAFTLIVRSSQSAKSATLVTKCVRCDSGVGAGTESWLLYVLRYFSSSTTYEPLDAAGSSELIRSYVTFSRMNVLQNIPRHNCLICSCLMSSRTYAKVWRRCRRRTMSYVIDDVREHVGLLPMELNEAAGAVAKSTNDIKN